jgi:hypothetical protein
MTSLLGTDVGDAKIQWMKVQSQKTLDHVSHLWNKCIRGVGPRDEVLRERFLMKTLAEYDLQALQTRKPPAEHLSELDLFSEAAEDQVETLVYHAKEDFHQ